MLRIFSEDPAQLMFRSEDTPGALLTQYEMTLAALYKIAAAEVIVRRVWQGDQLESAEHVFIHPARPYHHLTSLDDEHLVPDSQGKRVESKTSTIIKTPMTFALGVVLCTDVQAPSLKVYDMSSASPDLAKPEHLAPNTLTLAVKPIFEPHTEPPRTVGSL